MGREKEGYREMLYILNEQKIPKMLSRKKASEVIGISREKVAELIARGALEVDKATNKIPIGSVARYLCG